MCRGSTARVRGQHGKTEERILNTEVGETAEEEGRENTEGKRSHVRRRDAERATDCSNDAEQLEAARGAMEALAQKFGPEELARGAFGLCEQFRRVIPAGVKGWGAAGKLDLRQIAALG